MVRVHEPSPKESLNILNTVSEGYSLFHNVLYDSSALLEAVSLSNRYIKDRALPDKAIDLIDQAGARLKISSFKKPNSLKALEQIIVDQRLTMIPSNQYLLNINLRLENGEKNNLNPNLLFYQSIYKKLYSIDLIFPSRFCRKVILLDYQSFIKICRKMLSAKTM